MVFERVEFGGTAMVNEGILNLIDKYHSVSIIGMEKNVGKTTVLNYILNKTRGKYVLGLTSIGVDGEERDKVTFTEKPRIYIEQGTIIATARECLKRCDITMEIIENTYISTAMGQIIIVRALSDGYVELAGPASSAGISRVIKKLKSLECSKIFIDGALGRKTLASPVVTEGTILCTGAALSKDMYEVIDKTLHTAKLLSIEKEERYALNLASNIKADARICIIYEDNRIKYLDCTIAMDSAKEVCKFIEGARYVIIKGIVSDKFILDIMKSTDKFKNVCFLVEDGTKLFISRDVLKRFEKMGGMIKVTQSINIICITCNPISPFGYDFNKEKFLSEMKSRTNIPVFDIVGGN